MKLTKEDKMKSCFSLVKEMNTEEVMPAKHVTDAALTFQKKTEKGTELLNMENVSKGASLCY